MPRIAESAGGVKRRSARSEPRRRLVTRQAFAAMATIATIAPVRTAMARGVFLTVTGSLWTAPTASGGATHSPLARRPAVLKGRPVSYVRAYCRAMTERMVASWSLIKSPLTSMTTWCSVPVNSKGGL